MAGIVTYGVHVPVHRLDAATVSAAHGADPGRGRRSVACFDEDTTTMAVEAARRAGAPGGPEPTWIYFATTRPAYLEKTNAVAIHAALGAPASTGVTDLVGSVRGGMDALRVAMRSAGRALTIAADIRVGAPGGPDEIGGGDAAAAFVTTSGDDPVVAEHLGGATVVDEYLDRWRLPGDVVPRRWEESFGAGAAGPAAAEATLAALHHAGVDAADVGQVVVAGANFKAVRRAVKDCGIRASLPGKGLASQIGVPGAADVGLQLVAALDAAEPGEVVVVLSIADGADVLVFRRTDLPTAGGGATLARQLSQGRDGLAYARYLTWRGLIDPEQPRKAPPASYAAPVAYRRRSWKFGLEASRCRACGSRQLPPQRVCYACRTVDQMEREPMREVRGRLVAHTIDRLAWSPSPPAVFGIVDFDGGGRTELELTETDGHELSVGSRVELTFRVMNSRDGKRNYFWKARPVAEEE